jgi:hypothetical protein
MLVGVHRKCFHKAIRKILITASYITTEINQIYRNVKCVLLTSYTIIVLS